MFARFTPEARQACNIAGMEAGALGSHTIGTEHLLMGLICSDSAAKEAIGDKALLKLREALEMSEADRDAAATYSDNALEALRLADEEAGSDLISLQHLWGGILEDDSNGACQALMRAKIKKSVIKSAARSSAQIGPAGDLSASSLLIDLCEVAEEGKMGPAVGREAETERLMETLLRWHKSTPVLVGDPGVGKTAVVEGLAWLLAQGRVPEPLKDARIFSLDVGALVAGTRYRGDLEERMRRVLAQFQDRLDQVLFIDEIHMVLGAGGSEGQLDVGGLLKPLLARGQVRLVAATTTRDYHRYLLRDPAFERRLQPIEVSEPTPEETMAMLSSVAERLEEYHSLSISPDAIEAAVALSELYLVDRRFPDKAIDVLDQASAAASLGGKRKVNADSVASVMERWTGVPGGRLSMDQKKELSGLSDRLAAKVIDQPQATSLVARALRRSRVGLGPKGRPMGSFLFCGPTGVGKTELARVLASEVFPTGGLVRFDMSEYSEPSSASRLIGAAPGYVGHDEGGQLVNALRRKPHCVLVLDEIEKAHPTITHLLLQALEEGQLRDGRGQVADLRHVVVIMTSNLGSRWATHARPGLGFTSEEPDEARRRKMQEGLESFFAPELLGRLDEIVVFDPLSSSAMERVAKLMLTDLASRLSDQSVRLKFSPGVSGWVCEQNKDPGLGARPLRGIIRDSLEDRITDMLIDGQVQEGQTIHLGVRSGQLTVRV